MPLQQTSGNVTADAYGGGVAVVPNYIEDVFSTWLYQGNSSTQTITNGIDASTKGALTWVKRRDGTAAPHYLFDTARGGNRPLSTNTTTAQGAINSTDFTGFTTSGFTLGFVGNDINNINYNYASWTFREQPKFFDVVTYTGTGSTQNIAHNLGSVPGGIITKRTDTTGNWITYHRSLGNTDFVNLNTTAATSADSGAWDNTTPTSTQFTVGLGNTNVSGGTYVAYLFAHNAGGFGLTGTDNVISCGSFTTDASGNATVTLGYEPQWLLIKRTDATSPWFMADVMRGLSQTAVSYLNPNTTSAESSSSGLFPTATGFQLAGGLQINATYIYIAIRRGPMKVPTDATKVFAPYAASGAITSIPTGFPSDMEIQAYRTGGQSWSPEWISRLIGAQYTTSSSTAAEAATTVNWGSNTSVIRNGSAGSMYYNFQRAPGFFDEVCYTGDGTGDRSGIASNLGTQPELILLKRRDSTSDWNVAVKVGSYTNYYSTLRLNTTAASGSITVIFTSTGSFFVPSAFNTSAATYVAYLFATCPGVSKVGSYTGNGSTQTIDCGFTGGARFVLIKRTDSTGDWYVYDTARGMTTLTDPYLLLNSTAAESATLGSVTTVTTGFALNAAILAAINTNGASYIYLAIA